ncbi:MAG: Stress response protein NhaX [Syntrophomonadaceae bacterium]|nr:Stress response protein NhaX [Bacillota bacterium]
MKILVCTDGSKHDQPILETAAKIVGNGDADEIVVIHVYNQPLDALVRSDRGAYFIKEDDRERFRKLEDMHREEKKKILVEALKFFETKNKEASSLFEEGNPAEIISAVADKRNFDLIVIGNRGLSGLKKIFLGSVSNAVVQQSKTSVLIVK